VYSSDIPFQRAIVHLKRRLYAKVTTREVDVLTYPNGAHMTFGTSSPRVRFFGCLGFLTFLFIVKIPLEPHCNHLLANERSRHISSQR
jgi:hypothetical protein